MYLILSAGRSGSSVIAKYLHENGVSMGHAFHMPDQFNREGYFEDREFQTLNLEYLTRKALHKPLGDWRNRFMELVESRKEPWGLKEPSMCDDLALLKHYLALKPIIIYSVRDKRDTLDSFYRFRPNSSKRELQIMYKTRTETIESALKGKKYLTIDCYDENKFEKLNQLL